MVSYHASAAAERFYTCPLAELFQPWLARVLRLARHTGGEISRVFDLVDRPGVVLVDLVETAIRESQALHQHLAEARRREGPHGA